MNVLEVTEKDCSVCGLLCRTCNFGIGYFKDRVDLLVSAISYLGGDE